MSEVAKEADNGQVIMPLKSVKELMDLIIIDSRFDGNDLKAFKELFSRFEGEKKQLLAETQIKLIEELKTILSYGFEIKNIEDKKMLNFTLNKLGFQNFNPDLTKEGQLVKYVDGNVKVYEIEDVKSAQGIDEKKYVLKYIVDNNGTKTDASEVKTSDIGLDIYNSTEFGGYNSEVENQREKPKVSIFIDDGKFSSQETVRKMVEDALNINIKSKNDFVEPKFDFPIPYNIGQAPKIEIKQESLVIEENIKSEVQNSGVTDNQNLVNQSSESNLDSLKSEAKVQESVEYSDEIKALWYLDARPENKSIVLNYFKTDVFDVSLISKIKDFQSQNGLTSDGLAGKGTIGKMNDLMKPKENTQDIALDEKPSTQEKTQDVGEVISEVNSQSIDYFDVLTKAGIDLKQVDGQENIFEVDMKGLGDESPLIVLEDGKFRFQTSSFDLNNRDSVFEVDEVIELKEIIDDIDMIYILRTQNNKLKSSGRNEQFILDKIESNINQINLLTQKLTGSLPENETLTVDGVEHNVENINRVYQELVGLGLDIKKIGDKPGVYELDLPGLFDDSPLIINENGEIDFSTSSFEGYQFSKIPNSQELQKILININKYNDLKLDINQLSSQYKRETTDLLKNEIENKTKNLNEFEFSLLESPYILQTV